MGMMSRRKGRKGEQQLVLYLANRGWQAERILNQAHTAGLPDVKAYRNQQSYTFELKLRKDSFKSIYDLYFSEKDEEGCLNFVLNSGGIGVAVSRNWESLLSLDVYLRNLTLQPPLPKQLQAYNRLVRLEELGRHADFLVLRDNRKPMLFIRYWR